MDSINSISTFLIAVLLLSLRFGPLLTFAPPFTLLKIPAIIRMLLAISLALWLTLILPAQTIEKVIWGEGLIIMMIAELLMGLSLALPLQWAGAAILMTGRSVDIQAGFGLALLADPTTRSQIPLLGTILIYLAGAIFFAISGMQDLLIIFIESLKKIPIGEFVSPLNIPLITQYIVFVLSLAIGLVGMTLLTLFMIDMTVAFLSRTLPQMNVLLIGFQVKTMAVLITLPLGVALSMSIYVKIIRQALQTTAIVF